MSRRVLVTGATGFIGRELVLRLRQSGRDVTAMGGRDGDVRERGSFERHAGTGVGSVIHLAGRSFVPDSWADPSGFISTNVLGTANALEFCRSEKASMVYVSAYVYGVPHRLPIDESAPVRPNNPYAHSKYLAEQACRFFADHYSVPVTVIRPFNVYGPGQAASFLVPSIMRQLRAGQAIEVLDLEPRRDWVFVADVASAVAAAEALTRGYNVYNVGSGRSHSVAEVIAVAQRVAGTALPVKCATTRRPNEIDDVVADIARARQELGWSPAHDLEAGLLRCWQSEEKLK